MLPFIGGKANKARWIIENFPKDYQKMCYVEPFGGMAWVLLKKERSKIEVYNDINSDIVNLFKQVRDNSRELYRKLKYVPYSREVFYEYRDRYENGKCDNDLDRAIAVFVILSMGFAGWFRKKVSFGTGKKVTRKYSKIVNRIKFVCDRFTDVIIENLDYREIIKRYDSNNTLFYCDPPYLNTKGYYINEFNENDYYELFEYLDRIKGKFILTHYSNNILDRWAKNYEVIRKNGVKQCVGITDTSKMRGLQRERVVDLIIKNYDNKTNNNKIFDLHKKSGSELNVAI